MLQENDNYDYVHFALGVNYSLSKKADLAMFHFNKAIEIFPYHAEAWFNKGVLHKEKLEIMEMINCFKSVVNFGDDESFVQDAKNTLESFAKSVYESYGISIDEYQKGFILFEKAN